MIRCPKCGRKIDAVDPIPEHLNYMKTDRCPASGRRYEPVRPPVPTDADEVSVLLGIAALLGIRKGRR